MLKIYSDPSQAQGRYLLRALSLLLLAWAFTSIAYAQSVQFPDLVVTEKGDSVRCHIRTINDRTNEVFVLMPDSLKGTRRATFKAGALKYYSGGYYKNPYIIPAGYPVNSKGRLAFKPKLESCFFYLGLGPSFLLSPILDKGSGAARKHLKKLKTANSVNLDFGAYFLKHVGFFGHVEAFKSTANDPAVEDNINCLSVLFGPTARFPFRKDGSSYLYGSLAVGFAKAQSVPTYDAYEQNTTSMDSKLGYATIGVQISIFPNLGVQAQVSGSTNGMKAYPLYLKPDCRAALSRVGASAGISLTF